MMLKKSTFITFLWGFLTIYIFQLISSVIGFLYLLYLTTFLSNQEFIAYSVSSIAFVIDFLLECVRLCGFFAGGYFLGKRFGTKGWLFGLILGVIWTLFFYILSGELGAPTWTSAISLCLVAGLAMIGGWLGGRNKY